MARVVGFGVLRLIVVLFVVSLATFLLVDLVPGDPAVAILGDSATPERIEVVNQELGLNDPIIERYVNWLGDAVTGDLGNSLLHPGRSVKDLVLQSLPITLQLAVMGLVMALVFAIPVGMWAAYREGEPFDRVATGAASTLISIPSFLAALLLAFFAIFQTGIVRTLIAVMGASLVTAIVFGLARSRGRLDATERNVRLGGALVLAALTLVLVLWFPSFPRSGFSRLTAEEGLRENLRSAFLPALTLAMVETAVFARLLRGDMITTLRNDYILAARAKGMPTWRILLRDALRPSSFSLMTLAGVSLGRLIGGTVIVETVFGIQGMGRLVVNDGVIPGDYRIVQGGVLVISLFYVVINFLVDMSYAYLDPRIRRG